MSCSTFEVMGARAREACRRHRRRRERPAAVATRPSGLGSERAPCAENGGFLNGRSSQMPSGVGSDWIPGLNFVAGAGVEPATSGRIRDQVTSEVADERHPIALLVRLGGARQCTAGGSTHVTVAAKYPVVDVDDRVRTQLQAGASARRRGRWSSPRAADAASELALTERRRRSGSAGGPASRLRYQGPGRTWRTIAGGTKASTCPWP